MEKSTIFKFWAVLCTISSVFAVRGFLQSIVAQNIFWLIPIYGTLCGFLTTVTVVLWDISSQSPANSHTLKTILLQYFLGKIMTYLGKRVYARLLKSTENVKQVQENIMLQILDRNKYTEYGKLMNFEKITSREQFVLEQKLNSYADYLPYIQRMEKGERDLLVADDVVYFATSSGTTGENKVIPITGHMKGPAAMKFGPLMYYFANKTADMNLQRVFLLSYSARTHKTSQGLDKGPVSQHMYRYLPFVISPLEVFELTDEQLAIHAHALFALQETEIGRIEALMSTLVYSFWIYLETNWKLVCNDIESGCISVRQSETTEDDNINHNKRVLHSINKYLFPNPKRAHRLRQEFSHGFDNIAKRLWPNMSFARMLTTGGFAHHAKVLREHHMKGVKQLSQTHAASEGFMGFDTSDDAEAKTYMAMIEYAFMEFLPENLIFDVKPHTYFAEQVVIGRSYEIVLTTPMGLYRYRTGDVVKIVSFVNQCPVYSFEYRVGQILNLHWEKTPESVLYEALCDCLKRLDNKELVDYTATEDVNARAISVPRHGMKCYLLFLELKSKNNSDSELLSASEEQMFDEELCLKFELYRTFRSNSSIGPMLIIQVSPGTFSALKAKLIQSSQTQQYKLPRVMRHPEHLQFLWNHRMRKNMAD